MSRIFVNGINAKSAGGQSILSNFLKGVSDQSRHEFVVLVPNEKLYLQFARKSIQIVPAGVMAHRLIFPFANAFALPRLIRKHDCDLLFNLSDLPVPTVVRQIFLFDWAYAAFPESPAWQRLNLSGWIIRRAKLFFFERYLEHIDLMLAQNEVIRKRLEDLYDVPEIMVVPNAVSLDHMNESSSRDYGFGPGVKLLCLSQYYPHKNLEVFIPLAEQIKLKELPIKIITTISATQGRQAKAFLHEIDTRQLSEYLWNVGPVEMKDVPAIYAQVDGLLLPTLLESFSGTYVEAMYHEKPILTSDLDFARGVCGNAAFYFDPIDATSILRTIEMMIADPELTTQKICYGNKLLADMPDWHSVCSSLVALFDQQYGIAQGSISN